MLIHEQMTETIHTESDKMDGDDLPDLLGRGYLLLRFCGLHPNRLIGLQTTTLLVIGVVYAILYVTPAIFSIYEAMTIDGTVMELIENLQLPAGYTQIVGKLLTIILQRYTLQYLISNEYQFWNLANIKDAKLRKEIKQMCNNCLTIQTGLIVLTASALIMSDLAPFLIASRDLPVGTMNSVKNELLAKINFWMQEIGLIGSIIPLCAPDVIFIGACFKIAVQFKILGYTFKNIDFSRDRRKIIEAVEYHNFLLEYTNIFKKAFQFMLLSMFLSAFLILGQHMYAFNASERIDFGVLGRFFALLSQMAFFCFIAQMLSSEAEVVADAMYDSSWYENLSSFDRTVVNMVMARSLKPPKLSAYGLIDLNIDTLVKILKATFSLYSLLTSIK